MRLAQARWLARRTDRIVGCSEGVRQVLLDMGMPAERTVAIPNGINLAPFAEADARAFAQRVPGIVMVARFSKQKDHATLLRAVALLRGRGLRPTLQFAGGGKAMHRAPLEALATELGIADQVLPPWDREMTTPIATHLRASGVELFLGDSAAEFATREGGRLKLGGQLWPPMPAVDGLRLEGRWGVQDVAIAFGKDGRFTDDGLLAHTAFGDTRGHRPPNRGTPAG